jgi:signal transduction histidine kinase
LERSRKAVEDANREMAHQNLLAEMGKFSMMIAHEIKNPLGIMKSSFDILKKDTSPESSTLLIGYIEEEIQRINTLIEDFLSFAKPAKPSFRVIDANYMLKECLDRFGRLKPAENLQIRRRIPEETCLSYLDPDLCRRAIDNILKNAMEATQGRGVIIVDASCTDEIWRLEISDDGDGIPADVIDKIFDPFFTTRSKGTGLGLAYTAQVISANRGKITAANKPDGGAVFCIEIPREPLTGE